MARSGWKQGNWGGAMPVCDWYFAIYGRDLHHFAPRCQHSERAYPNANSAPRPWSAAAIL